MPSQHEKHENPDTNDPQDRVEREEKTKPDHTERHTHVRFSEEEFLRIHEDSETLGETIPGLLKRVYFERAIVRPLLSHDAAQRVLVALARIGNNVNQIARRLNSGFREGWRDEIVQAIDELRMLRTYVGGSSGHH